MSAKEKAVVIGAGMGGLAAAIRLSALGLSVTVVDMADAPGGKARAVASEWRKFTSRPASSKGRRRVGVPSPSTRAHEVGDDEWRHVFAHMVDPMPRLVAAVRAQVPA